MNFPDICHGCGACVGICSTKAVKMVLNDKGNYKPVIDKFNCISCGLCYKVCPILHNNQDELDSFVFVEKRKYDKEEISIGKYTKIYTGYSTDDNTRINASSGGVITTVLKYLLREKLVDNVLVCIFDPLTKVPTPFIAKTENEIMHSMGSKYAPLAMCEKIVDILKEEGSFAVVGLPCHIQGFRRAEIINKKLRDKILLHIGLCCGGGTSLEATELFVKHLNVSDLKYRGNGWPGACSLLINNEKYTIPFLKYFPLIRSFYSLECFACWDSTNEFADISFGDAWLEELKSDKKGTSLVITRTLKSDKLLEEMNKELFLKEISVNDAIISQKKIIDLKKRFLLSRFRYASLFFKDFPSFKKIKLLQGSLSIKQVIIYKITLFIYFIRYAIFSNKFLRKNLITPLITLIIKKELKNDI